VKLFSFLNRDKPNRKSPPIRTVTPPAVARAERLQRDAGQTGSHQADQSHQEIRTITSEIDPAFEDTGSLALTQDNPVGGNPYDTHSWELDPNEGMRRVDDTKAHRSKAPKSPKRSKDQSNPYDTIVGRKGW
jgi:hypothetical protein